MVKHGLKKNWFFKVIKSTATRQNAEFFFAGIFALLQNRAKSEHINRKAKRIKITQRHTYKMLHSILSIVWVFVRDKMKCMAWHWIHCMTGVNMCLPSLYHFFSDTINYADQKRQPVHRYAFAKIFTIKWNSTQLNIDVCVSKQFKIVQFLHTKFRPYTWYIFLPAYTFYTPILHLNDDFVQTREAESKLKKAQ